MNTVTIPSLGLGMKHIPNNDHGKMILENALKCGYRLFDTTPHYNNEEILGNVIRSCSIDRKEIFVITKIGIDSIVKGDPFILDSIESSLNKLNIDYIDLLLLEHSANKQNVNVYAWETLINVYTNMFDNMNEKVRAIGVSNYSEQDIDELITKTNFTPMFHQFELSPFMYDKNMISFCENNGISIISHSSLSNYEDISHNAFRALCTKRKVTPAQLMIRWGIQKGHTVLIGTCDLNHLKENIDISKFCLSLHDYEFMTKINKLNTMC